MKFLIIIASLMMSSKAYTTADSEWYKPTKKEVSDCKNTKTDFSTESVAVVYANFNKERSMFCFPLPPGVQAPPSPTKWYRTKFGL